MKKLFLIAFSFIFLVIFSSCTKEDNPETGTTVTLKVDGVSWNLDASSASILDFSSFGEGVLVTIIGGNTSGNQTLSLTIFDDSAIGEKIYPFSSSSNPSAYGTLTISSSAGGSFPDIYTDNGTGNATVTKKTNNRISGTFEGTLIPNSGTRSVMVTEGKFENLQIPGK